MKDINRATLKLEAKKRLRGNWGWAVGLTAAMLIIAWLFAVPVSIKKISIRPDVMTFSSNISLGVISSLFASFFALSLSIAFLRFMRGHKDNFLDSLFAVFTKGRFVPELLAYLLQFLYTFLWGLLLFVPGIIKGYSYAMTPYIVNDLVESGQEVHYNEAITASRNLMRGHKWQLFVLRLSFFGWLFLSAFTLGIGYLWVVPYMEATEANFYRALAGDSYLKVKTASSEVS